MEKKIYTKQELVDKAIRSCISVVESEIVENGHIDFETYRILALPCINALLDLDIIDFTEYKILRLYSDDYRKKRNDLVARMDGEL